MREWDEILISGNIISEREYPHVENLAAMIATISGDDIKVWPMNDSDPQLAPKHNGKLWFEIKSSKIQITKPNED